MRRSTLAWIAVVIASLSAGARATVDVTGVLTREVTAALGSAVPASARVHITLTSRIDAPVDEVRDVVHDPRTGDVRAKAVIAGRAYEFGAKAEILIDIPVPTRRVAAGEVLNAEDLTDIEVPIKRVGDMTVTDRNALIGFAAKHQLGPGRPVPTTAIGTPIVVVRNKPVSLVYEDGTLRLDTGGRALGSAGVGERVRAMNNASGAVVVGVVSAPGVVSVTGAEGRDDPSADRDRERK